MPTQNTYKADEIYNESVTVSEKQQNLFMYDDGNSKTIVPGMGFIAKSVGFVNTAGSDRDQVVALRVAFDYSAIFDFRINGYQTSLKSNNNIEKYAVIAPVRSIRQQTATMVIQNCTIVLDEKLFPDRLLLLLETGGVLKE
ncbi:hypothetical protein Patl1_19378 [Pistacia atlantica]|uniref:Uncharacterized protein n=1 Tax=Pistacia atlantica TaxID=434234 RepID=A0ACC1BZW0_9ROSI|nr:hypothetical protein Patl1_19378 [Pistacia atlantica]